MKNFIVDSGRLPSGMRRELSGRNEKRGQLSAARNIARNLKRTGQAGIKGSPKVGGRYYYSGIGYTNASKAGTYPAKQTGRLGRSLKFRIENSTWFRFGATAEYAKYLQWSDDPTKPIDAGGGERPVLTLAHNANEKHFKKQMANFILKEVAK